MEVLSFPPGDPKLVDQIVNEFLSQGKFDQLRKECMADVDTKPAYQNLQQRVETTVATFLKKQIWSPDLVKNQLRDSLKKHILESGFLEAGINRIVDQVVNPKILATVFLPQVEEVVYNYLGVQKHVTESESPKYIPPLLELKFDKMKIKTPGDEDVSNKELENIDMDKSNPVKTECVDEPKIKTFDSAMDVDQSPERNLSRVSNDSHLSGISELTEHGSVEVHAGEPVGEEMLVPVLDQVVLSDSDDDIIRGKMSPISVRDSSPEPERVETPPPPVKVQGRKIYSSDSDSNTSKNEDSSLSEKQEEKAEKKVEESSKKKENKSRSDSGERKKHEKSSDRHRHSSSSSRKSEHKDKDDSRRHSQSSKHDKSRDKERRDKKDDRRDKDHRRDKEEKYKKEDKVKKEDSAESKDEDRDKKKKTKTMDDHESEKRKKEDRRSTDRDSKERDDNSGCGASTSKRQSDGKRKERRNDDRKERKKSDKEAKDDVEKKKEYSPPKDLELVLKMKKPKIATNFKEFCKIRKLRKKMNDMEKQFKHQIENLMADFEGNTEDKTEAKITENQEEIVEARNYTQLCKEGKYKTVDSPIMKDYKFPQFDGSTGFKYFEEWEAVHMEFEQDYKEFVMGLTPDNIEDDDSDKDEDVYETNEFNRNLFECYSKSESNFIGSYEYDDKTEEFYCRISDKNELEQKENNCLGQKKYKNMFVKPLLECNRKTANNDGVDSCIDKDDGSVDLVEEKDDVDNLEHVCNIEMDIDGGDKSEANNSNPYVNGGNDYPNLYKRRQLGDDGEGRNHFHLPPSPDSDDYKKFTNGVPLVEQKKRTWSTNRKKPIVKEKRQKYNASDLYKPRLSFSSSSRSRTQTND